MSSNQAVIASTRSLRPGFAIMIATAFAVGGLLGIAIQGAFDRATIATAASSQGVEGVAENNMGEAANAAERGTVGPAWKGVADNNMSDAASAAQHASGATPWIRGVSDNNMSDAARLATQASSR